MVTGCKLLLGYEDVSCLFKGSKGRRKPFLMVSTHLIWYHYACVLRVCPLLQNSRWNKMLCICWYSLKLHVCTFQATLTYAIRHDLTPLLFCLLPCWSPVASLLSISTWTYLITLVLIVRPASVRSVSSTSRYHCRLLVMDFFGFRISFFPDLFSCAPVISLPPVRGL